MFRRTLAFAALYAVAIALGRATAPPENGLALFWPAAGVGVLWALRSRTPRELAVVLGLTGVLAAIGNGVTGLPPAPALVLGVANVVIGAVVVLVLSLTESGRVRVVERLADFWRLVLAAAVATAASAVIGVAGLALATGHLTPTAAVGWWLRTMTAVIVIAAPALTLGGAPLRRRAGLVAETVAIVALSAGALGLVFGAGQELPLAFVLLPFVVWAAMRLPLPWAAAVGGGLAVGVLVMVRTVGGGPFGAVDDPAARAVVLQAFMMVEVFLTLVVATVRAQLEDLVDRLATARHRAEESATDLRTIAEALPTALFVIDDRGGLRYANGEARRFVTGAPVAGTARLEDVLAKYTVDGDDIPLADRPSTRVLNGQAVVGQRLAADDVDGRRRVVSVSGIPLESSQAHGTRRGVLLWHDVTEEHHHVDDLLSERARSDQMVEDAPHGVVVLRPEGEIVRANRAMAELFECDAEALVGVTAHALAQDSPAAVTAYLARTVVAGGALVEGEWDVTTMTGRSLRVATTSRVVVGRSGDQEILVNIVDVSERRRYEARLAHLAAHDALTGLPNRRRFEEVLTRHQEHCERYGARGALLLIDLDHFKDVNDTLGHAAGDQLIVSAATLLRDAIRATDEVARLGGDEFAVLLPEADLAAAEVVATTIVERVRAHCADLGGPHQRVTASIGVITFAAAAERGGDVLALADMLMYDAKEAGRDRFAVLGDSAHPLPRTGARMEWRTKLERAIETDAFELHLQPILEISSDTVTAAEALLRLRDGDEVVMPGTFMPIAELTGLAPRVDQWVLRHAVATLAEIQRGTPDFVLEINLSAHSIGDPEVEATLSDALRRHGVDPATVILEVTETAAVRDVAAARAFATRLSHAGTRFALDDFGAGYGSFYYLKHLLFDQVKIDGEFVAGAHRSAVDRTILRSIVAVAHNLGKTTVAEFVESREGLDVIRALDVDYAQGYLIGRPVPLPDFVDQHLSGRRTGPLGALRSGSPQRV